MELEIYERLCEDGYRNRADQILNEAYVFIDSKKELTEVVLNHIGILELNGINQESVWLEQYQGRFVTIRKIPLGFGAS